MGLATLAERKIGGIIDWEAQFSHDGIAEVPVVDAVAGDDAAHPNKRV